MNAKEYAERAAKVWRVVWVDGFPWFLSRHMIEPVTVRRPMLPVDRTRVRQAMRETGALAARWSDAWDTGPCDWWFICCDDPEYDLEKFDRRGRRATRQGLKRCEVRQVTPAWLAENAYETCVAASHAYRSGALIPTRATFVEGMTNYQDLGTEAWAGFVQGDLAAYVVCDVVDGVANVTVTRFNRAYSNAQPANALTYALTRHYLVERGMWCVAQGKRVVHHKTEWQDFLERMGYRRVYCPLRLELSPLAAWVLRLGVHRWGRYLGLGRVAPGMLTGLQALALLDEIAGKCSGAPVPKPETPHTAGEANIR